MIKKSLLSVFAFALCFMSFTVMSYASGGEEVLTVSTGVTGSAEENAPLLVNAAVVDGDMMKINVTDVNGVESALALRLKDYVNDAENDEFISVQAVDLQGNMSGVIQLKNPYYVPPAETEAESKSGGITEPEQTPAASAPAPETAVPEANESESGIPFTPEGAGAVVDNAESGDGKEFFTIDTEEGNVFYLIVDRQRETENVYLLNAVTEGDLAALAEKDGETAGTSAIPTPEPEPEKPEPTAAPAPEPEPEATASGINGSTVIFIVLAVVIAGGAAYYFKIIRGKNRADEAEDDGDYEYEDDTEDDTGEAGESSEMEYGEHDAEREDDEE